MRSRLTLILFVALALVAAACGGDDGGSDTTTTPTTAAATPTTAAEGTTTTVADTTTTTADVCAVENLNLVTPGQLTVATGEPAFPPWVSGIDGENFDDPESQTGFEAALVYELAAELGFADDQVVWVRTGFDQAIAPGPKDWDFNLQQFSITEAREEVVDFSEPYYETRQALIALADSPVIGATSFADLADAKLGAQIGTTSLDYIEDVIQPNEQPAVYDTNSDAKSALEAQQLDGIVVDLPTAYFITAVEIPEATIVAQFEAPAAEPDLYGMLFAEGNTLVDCVNTALGALRNGGVLEQLEQEWLAQGGNVATISE
ncbi:MAG: ABC transporter substrate-binding protein [Acidimicrobiia bacterium]|nr:ABC transporter substrate-binding protein [Acidimicrobiia bacterium]